MSGHHVGQGYDIVGQLAAAMMQPGSVPGPGLAYGGAPSVVDQPITKMRELSLGFGPTSVDAGAEALIVSQPQVVFRGERLIVSPQSDGSFPWSILDVKVGNKSQFVSSNAVPAAVYGPTAVGSRMSMDTAQISQQVSISVENTDGSNAHSFSAAILGTAAA